MLDRPFDRSLHADRDRGPGLAVELAEGKDPKQTGPRGHGQGEQIAARGALTQSDLRRDVARRAAELPHEGPVEPTRAAKVREPSRALLDQNVERLDVAVDVARRVQVKQARA